MRHGDFQKRRGCFKDESWKLDVQTPADKGDGSVVYVAATRMVVLADADTEQEGRDRLMKKKNEKKKRRNALKS